MSELVKRIDSRLAWRFDASQGFDMSFHELIAELGIDVILPLDGFVLLPTRQAAQKAVMLFQEKALELGAQPEVVSEQTRQLMQQLAKALKDNNIDVSHEPLLPEQTVFMPTVEASTA